jgi:hypothetical protein
MSFLKHIGKQGDRKVCILFREVPNEDHMCLVIYPDVLPAPWEDAIMKVIESDMGQQAEEFADALHRSLLPDGRPILETLHVEKMIKKIRTADVIVTPRANSSIRLDELNTMLREMKTGEAAIKRLAESDAARGMVDPALKRKAEAAYKKTQEDARDVRRAALPTIAAPQDGALSDRDLAANMLAQAQRMEADAKSLISEAANMKKDAERMFPGVAAPKTSKGEAKPKRTRADAAGVNKNKAATVDAS